MNKSLESEKDRPKKKSGCMPIVVLMIVPFAIVFGWEVYDEYHLEYLRQNNPTAYLEELKKDPHAYEQYWKELKTLDPEQYAIEKEKERREIDNQWRELYGIGRTNSVDYIERYYGEILEGINENIDFSNRTKLGSKRSTQRMLYTKWQYEASINYARQHIPTGEFDLFIENSIIRYMSYECEDEPSYDKQPTIQDLIDKPLPVWPAIVEKNAELEQLGLLGFTPLVILGATKSYKRDGLLRPLPTELGDLADVCRRYVGLVRQNRFYNAYYVVSPELKTE